MKDIVIVANFCRDFSENDNGRFMYLCKQLSKEHSVEIITSDFSHSAKKHKPQLNHNWPFKITFLHEPGYKKNISVKRFFSHYKWGKEVKQYLKNREKPDVVYCAIPSLTAAKEAALYCESNKIKFVIDIQDLWPEAFKMVFNPPLIGGLIYAPFKYLADKSYKMADEVIAVSNTYVNRAMIVNKKIYSGTPVFLGTDLNEFDKNVNENCNDVVYEFNLKEKKNNTLWLAYCGSLGDSYDIKCVIDALDIIKSKGMKAPKFIVMGDGYKKNVFQDYAMEKNVDVYFTGKLEYPKMCALLSLCDITVNPIVGNSAASIINKHADYAAAGKPVINTQESLEYRNLVDEYNMGLNCSNNDSEDLARKIELLVENEFLREEMSKNARICAEERFDRGKSYCELLKCISNEI